MKKIHEISFGLADETPTNFMIHSPNNICKNHLGVNYIYSTEYKKCKSRRGERNVLSKSKPSTRPSSHRKYSKMGFENPNGPVDYELDNTPGLISIINDNQLKQDNVPKVAKKSLADHLRKKAIMRFNQETKMPKNTKHKKEIEERRRQIEHEINEKMALDFMKPSIDYSSKDLLSYIFRQDKQTGKGDPNIQGAYVGTIF